ncbi:MAG: hypothetical protein K6E99_04630 [Bacilli bacterium]|nr:hypothetical protein [Bacilli bacterium]
MIKYIYNSDGYYVAYIVDGLYCFSSNNDYIGFMNGINLYDYDGKYMGTLTNDDRIVRNEFSVFPNILPVMKPFKPFQPLSPMKRFKMSNLGIGYTDIFLHKNTRINYKKLDNKFAMYLNCELYDLNNNFLGCINENKHDKNSIANRFGIYGSQYSKLSIFNKYGPYGSKYSVFSQLNQYSKNYLVLKKAGKNVGKISDNKYLSKDIISATDFFNWYKDRCDL